MKRSLAVVLLCAGISSAEAQTKDETGSCLDMSPFHAPAETLAACQHVSPASLDTKVQAKVHYQEGASFYWLGDFERAKASLDESLRLDSQLAMAQVRRAWLYRLQDEDQKAMDDFRAILAYDPKNARAVFGVGFMYGLAGDTVKQHAYYKQAVELDPQYYYAKSALIDLEYALDGNPEKALVALDALLALGEEKLNTVEFTGGWLGFATKDYYTNKLLDRMNYLWRAGRNEEALADANKLAKRYPRDPEPLFFLAFAHEALKRYGDMLVFADRAIGICGESFRPGVCNQALLSKARAYYGLGAYEAAKEAAEVAYEWSIGDVSKAEAAYYTGLSMRHLGQTAQAKEKLVEGVSLDPSLNTLLLTQLVQSGYYDGQTTDPMSNKVLVGLEACMLDQACIAAARP